LPKRNPGLELANAFSVVHRRPQRSAIMRSQVAPTAFFGMLSFGDAPDLTGTVKAERISCQWIATSANMTDSARQDHMIAWAISTPRASIPSLPKESDRQCSPDES
jgi:hypothetical protein